MRAHRCAAAAVAAALASLITACSAQEPTVASAPGATTTPSGSVTVPTDSGSVTVPAGTGATTGSGTGATGPNEKERQRGNTPPGLSRDGQGPAGGAIMDPTGAATGKR